MLDVKEQEAVSLVTNGGAEQANDEAAGNDEIPAQTADVIN